MVLAACTAALPTTDSASSGASPGSGGEIQRQSAASSEELVPYAAPMNYPENWPEITRKRQGE
jgi:hypothetical protein